MINRFIILGQYLKLSPLYILQSVNRTHALVINLSTTKLKWFGAFMVRKTSSG